MKRLLVALLAAGAIAGCKFDLTNLSLSGCTPLTTLVDSTRISGDTTVHVDTTKSKVCALP